jgi:hypothetical protein
MPVPKNDNQTFYSLFNALQVAALNEIRLAQFLREHNSHKKEEAILQQLDQMSGVALPEAMGRLIGTLDLQNAFLSLGRYIRGFGDAEFVMDKLQEAVMDRLANCEDRQKAESIIIQALLCSDNYSALFSSLNKQD